MFSGLTKNEDDVKKETTPKIKTTLKRQKTTKKRMTLNMMTPKIEISLKVKIN